MSDSNDIADFESELRNSGLPEEVLALLEFQPDPESNELILRNLREKGKYVVVERQNFSWFGFVCRQVGNLVLAGAFPAWAPGAIADLVFLMIDYRKKSIEVNAEEGAVLLRLKKSPGLSVAALAKELEFDEAKTLAILNALQNEKRRDKVPVKLVACDAQGLWSAPNV